MNSRHLAGVPAFALLVVITTLGAPALAYGGEPCPPTVVEGDAELARLVRDALGRREDVDTCAHVKITTAHGAIAVEVELPDGRSTSRSVSRREDVVPMVEALLLVPRRPEPEAPTTTETPASEGPKTPMSPSDSDLTDVHSDDRTSSDAKTAMIVRPGTPRRVRFEVSMATGARVQSDQTTLALGLLSFIDVGGWLAGLAGRADVSQGTMSGEGSSTVSLGLLGGRRISFRNVSLDIYGGPAVAHQKSGDSDAPTEIIKPPIREPGPHTVPRLLVGTRLSFLPRSVFRPFVAFDGDFGPRGGFEGPRSEDRRFPLWSVGGSIGATVGTL